MGGFHVLGRVNTESVNYSAIPYKNGFAAPILPSESQFDINLHEMEAILFAFHQWGHQWAKKRVVIYTDNASCQAGLLKQTLRSRAFRPLRQILLLAAQLDILLEPIWIPGHTNILADALSQFNFEQIANICPHWQPYFRNHHPPSIVGNRQYHT